MLDKSSRREDREQDRDVLLGRLVDEYFERKARGEPVDETELLADHPELAEEFKAHIEAVRSLQPATDTIAELIERGLLTPSSDPAYAAQLGRYKVAAIIGVGGMGIVLEAYDEDLGRTIALKLLRPEFSRDEAALARFVREAKAAAALRHPNLVTIHAIERVRGTPYIAMERVNGPSLADVIREQGPLPTEMIREVFRQLLSGLSAAHDAGLIHRDIKPSNILLDGYPHGPGISTATVKERTPLTVKIADFGLARMISSQTRMTLPDSLLGTPEYMSPEQARGDDNIDQRTDLYSAGVVLYEMLTGRTPFKADSPTAVIHEILHEEPAGPRTLNDATDPFLAGLALRLMAKRREDRPASARGVIAGPGGSERGATLSIRRALPRWLVAAVVGVLLFTVGVLFVSQSRWSSLSPDPPSASPRVDRLQNYVATPADDVTAARPQIADVRPGDEGDGLEMTIQVRRGQSTDWEVFFDFRTEGVSVNTAEKLDSDGDSEPDLIVAGLEGSIQGDSLFAFNMDGQEVWKMNMSDGRQWPDCALPHKSWDVRVIAKADLDGTSGEEAVVVAHDPEESPTRVSLIDPSTGDIQSTFWHFGQIQSIVVLPDYFSDGRSALVAYGPNDALDGFIDEPPADGLPVPGWDQVLVVMILDPLDMDGFGPLPTRLLPESSAATPVAYAFLDLSPWGEHRQVRRVDGAVVRQPTGEPPAVVAAIADVREEFRKFDEGDAPWLRVVTVLWTPDGDTASWGTPIVDRNLNLCEVTSRRPGLTPEKARAFWTSCWRPIVQNGRYVDRE